MTAGAVVEPVRTTSTGPAQRSTPPSAGRTAPRVLSRARGGLGLGVATLYMSVIVLIPLAAVVAKAFSQSPGALWASISNSESVKALVTTIIAALVTALVSAVMGTLIAWVLVRDDFPGKSLLNAIIDLPFAMPTIVAGLALLVLYGPGSPIGIDIDLTRTIVLIALLFVTLPFTVRSVQPVLQELDGEAEQAAASLGAGNLTIFRRVVLPSLRSAILSGAALSFARAIGEIGSLLIIAGKVSIASIVIYSDIEGGGSQDAASLSIVLIALSLVVLFAIRRIGGRVAH